MKKLTHEEFKNRIFKLFENEYSILGEYINNETEILVKHNTCGYEYKTKPKNLLAGSKCFKCYGSKKKTTEEFKNEVKEKYGNEYVVLGKYKTNKTPILMKHSCGYEFNVRPYNFLSNGTRCRKCYGVFKGTTESFKEKVYNLVKDEYIVMGEYIDINTKILIKHEKCGNLYEVRPYDFIKKDGNRCPKCSSNRSKGEERVETWLKNNNIKYKRGELIEDCKRIRILPFDFKIYINETDFILLEFDGDQHYKERYYNQKETLEVRKERDRIKNEYCKDNNIELIRIPYWDYNNIETILANRVKKKYHL